MMIDTSPYDELMSRSYTDSDPNDLIGKPFIVHPKLFTADECDLVNQYFDSLQSVIGWVGEKDGEYLQPKEIHTLRKCVVTYAENNDASRWFHSKIESHTDLLNAQYWRCEVADYSQPIRRMSYGPTDHFKSWHPDYGMGQTAYRKLTTVVLLDDPSEFTGGDFEVACWGVVPLQKGDSITFPTYIYHRVTPVLSGLRRSLVHRAIGPRFK